MCSARVVTGRTRRPCFLRVNNNNGHVIHTGRTLNDTDQIRASIIKYVFHIIDPIVGRGEGVIVDGATHDSGRSDHERPSSLRYQGFFYPLGDVTRSYYDLRASQVRGRVSMTRIPVVASYTRTGVSDTREDGLSRRQCVHHNTS